MPEARPVRMPWVSDHLSDQLPAWLHAYLVSDGATALARKFPLPRAVRPTQTLAGLEGSAQRELAVSAGGVRVQVALTQSRGRGRRSTGAPERSTEAATVDCVAA